MASGRDMHVLSDRYGTEDSVVKECYESPEEEKHLLFGEFRKEQLLEGSLCRKALLMARYLQFV